MAAAAVVPVGNKTGAVGGVGGGGVGPHPVGDKSSAFRQMKREADEAKKSVLELGVETQKSFRNAAGVITRTIGLITAMGAAAAGVVKIAQRIADGFTGGEVAASKFFASVGSGVGKEAERVLKATEDRIQKINDELSKRPAMSVLERLMSSPQALKDEQRLLVQSLSGLRGQIEGQKQRAVDARIAEAERNKAAEAERRQIKDLGDGYEELLNLKRALATPQGQLDMDLDLQLKMAQKMRDSMGGMFSNVADQLEKAAKEAWKRSGDELKKIAQEAITEAMNDAIKNQVGGFGLGQMVTTLSQMSQKMDAIRAGLPRRWR